MQAMHAGYTSVMIDGSKLDFEDNIRETRRVADVAAALDIPCEAELGKVGGKEDDLEAEADTNTDPAGGEGIRGAYRCYFPGSCHRNRTWFLCGNTGS